MILSGCWYGTSSDAKKILYPQCENSHESEENHEIPQPIPVWAAYNSLICKSHLDGDTPYKLDKVHALPLINAPAHDWTTVTTSLMQLRKLDQYMRTDKFDKVEPTLVWLDMDKRTIVQKGAQTLFIRQQVPRQHIIASLGPFHIVLCALSCLGATIESSGLDMTWIEAGHYSSVTVAQILNG